MLTQAKEHHITHITDAMMPTQVGMTKLGGYRALKKKAGHNA